MEIQEVVEEEVLVVDEPEEIVEVNEEIIDKEFVSADNIAQAEEQFMQEEIMEKEVKSIEQLV